MSVPAPPDWRLQVFGEMGSTQDAAIAAARAGAPDRLAIRADRQTAGRGSRGRVWTTPAGNLSLSVLLRPVQTLPDPGRWSLLAAVALHDALAPHVPHGLMLKWPNDVLRDGAKLGGILIDSEVSPDGSLAWVVIGFGANLATAADVPGRATACLPAPVAADRVAASVLSALDRWGGRSLPDITAAWLRRAHPIGTWLDAKLPGRHVAGPFAGLTPDGALLIAGQAAPIRSGEIFLQGGTPCC